MIHPLSLSLFLLLFLLIIKSSFPIFFTLAFRQVVNVVAYAQMDTGHGVATQGYNALDS
ncbi:hypothetical protein ASPZODRAFT_132147 [Penicilliopsis zonata CBS 506.65]|uniref:Uncharacterized protein n=1 Tax=Penicilliopsis zonata CBS 506.65 TaxID=1073090 RepID=A0A1L9SJ55_9EURO|nr:hypothetical protein ASPZODRAFT_132147 [Penicilliopsis zonata CBS 506.65]OJJ47187.1 hypothetical protein ASPZODRAFT_132147 [Penicilliopsis zonata CBS 506.65]